MPTELGEHALADGRHNLVFDAELLELCRFFQAAAVDGCGILALDADLPCTGETGERQNRARQE
jgi:hypothetical protein